MNWLKIICCCVILQIASSSAFAQREGKLAQTGMVFLDIPVGTRAASMGEAFMSISDDVNAIFWNPAGIARLDKREFMVNYNNWIADITHASAAFAFSAGNIGTFGFSVIAMDYGEIKGTRFASNDLGYERISDISPTEFSIAATFARQVSNQFSFGFNVKFVRQDLGNSMVGNTSDAVREVSNSINELAFDFGTLFYTGFKDSRFAVSVRNFSREVGYREEDFPMPLTFSFGIAMDVLELYSSNENHTLTVAVDALHPRDYPERINFGAEYWFANTIALRSGYKFVTDEEGLTLGLGFKQDLGTTRVKIDYAFSDFGLFDPVHRFSVGLGF